MSTPYLGQIKIFAGNFAIFGWAFCNGQLLPISQNEALFVLLGTTYGGDGVSTFGLPDLRGRVPVHFGQGPGLSNYPLGELTGVETVTLTTNTMPAHNHSVRADPASGDQASPANTYLAGGVGVARYVAAAPASAMSGSAIGASGGSQPHPNIQPILALNFIIALEGIFPSRN